MNNTDHDVNGIGTTSDGTKGMQASESLQIPKHRFDCVNLCLKETKQTLKETLQELEECRARAELLEKAWIESKVETALATARAKDLTAAKALIDFSKLQPTEDGALSGLDRQIADLQESRGFLFEEQESVSYIVVPVKKTDTIHKSITGYVKKNRRATL